MISINEALETLRSFRYDINNGRPLDLNAKTLESLDIAIMALEKQTKKHFYRKDKRL